MSSSDWHPTDIYLTKRLLKMIGRIERMVDSQLSNKLTDLIKWVEGGFYYLDNDCVVKQLSTGRKIVSKNTSSSSSSDDQIRSYKIVQWDKLKEDITNIISQGIEGYVVPEKLAAEMVTEETLHHEEEAKLKAKEKLRLLQLRNGLPILPGKWRKDPFAPRKYEKLQVNYTIHD